MRLADVASGPVARPVRGTGVVRLKSEADLSFKVGGVIAALYVEEGAQVRRGQVLASLDPTEVDAALRVLEEFRKKTSATAIEGMTRSVSIGVSSRGGRLIQENVLREEADIAVAKASREGGNQVIGFRVDASRFRTSLTGSLS